MHTRGAVLAITMLLFLALMLSSQHRVYSIPGEIVNARDGSVLVPVPAGTYVIGHQGPPGTGYGGSEPRHRVTLEPFYIGKYEVTNAQFRKFSAATNRPSEPWQKYASLWGEHAPVVAVSWYDACDYCAWAGLRLPTEMEWEAAARGTDARLYPWGTEFDPLKCRSALTPCDGPAEVGSYPAGASAVGAMDMAGNVWEWTSSPWKEYPGAPPEPETRPGLRVLRGGGWKSQRLNHLSSAFRGRNETTVRAIPGTGFRVACDRR